MKQLLSLVLLFAAVAAQAQLRLPQLPQLPQGQSLEPLGRQRLPELAGPLLSRVEQIAERLRLQPARWARDPQGAAVLRDELLWLAPSAELRTRAEAAGWRLLQQLPLQGLGLELWRVAPPPGLAWEQAREALQALGAAEAAVDYQHLYLPAGQLQAVAAMAASAAAAGGAVGPPRLGLIDGGVDAEHPALRGSRLRNAGCSQPSSHGTAVASLLVGQGEGLRSAWPGAALAVADIYCEQEGSGGTAARLVAALDWLLREQVAVVNISLVGPPNRLLEAAVAAAQARGQLLVAAAGNDGPAAPPLYPAAYAGVIAVGAVDERRRPLPEGARGAHLGAVAQGSGLRVAQSGGDWAAARGTSFASPWIAGRLAAAWGSGPPQPARAQQLVAALRAQLEDLGASGPDPVFGWGLAGPRWRLQPPP